MGEIGTKATECTLIALPPGSINFIASDKSHGWHFAIFKSQAQPQVPIAILVIQTRVHMQIADICLRQRKHSHRSGPRHQDRGKRRPKNKGKSFGNGSGFHFQVEPVGLPRSRRVGDIPFHRRKQVLAVAE